MWIDLQIWRHTMCTIRFIGFYFPRRLGREEQSSGRVLAVCASASGRLVAALNDHKTACVWRAESGDRVAWWQTSRKGSCLTFCRDEQALLVAGQ